MTKRYWTSAVAALFLLGFAYVGATAIQSGIRADVVSAPKSSPITAKMVLIDQNGAAVANAQIALTSVETESHSALSVSDRSGVYIGTISTGSYVASITAAGYLATTELIAFSRQAPTVTVILSALP